MEQSFVQRIQENLTDTIEVLKNGAWGSLQNELKYFNDSNFKPKSIPPELQDVSIKLVYEHGGEGMGDSQQIVFEIKDATGAVLIGDTGYYDSYHGTEWDNSWHFVEPYEFTEIRYRVVEK